MPKHGAPKHSPVDVDDPERNNDRGDGADHDEGLGNDREHTNNDRGNGHGSLDDEARGPVDVDDPDRNNDRGDGADHDEGLGNDRDHTDNGHGPDAQNDEAPGFQDEIDALIERAEGLGGSEAAIAQINGVIAEAEHDSNWLAELLRVFREMTDEQLSAQMAEADVVVDDAPVDLQGTYGHWLEVRDATPEEIDAFMARAAGLGLSDQVLEDFSAWSAEHPSVAAEAFDLWAAAGLSDEQLAIAIASKVDGMFGENTFYVQGEACDPIDEPATGLKGIVFVDIIPVDETCEPEGGELKEPALTIDDPVVEEPAAVVDAPAPTTGGPVEDAVAPLPDTPTVDAPMLADAPVMTADVPVEVATSDVLVERDELPVPVVERDTHPEVDLEIDEPAVDVEQPAPIPAPEVVVGHEVPDLDEDFGADAVPPAEPAPTPETAELDVVEVALQPVRHDAGAAVPDEAVELPEVGDFLTELIEDIVEPVVDVFTD